MKFIDLFAGLGGFGWALTNLGHECVFTSEIDDELRRVYKTNFPDHASVTFGDIRETSIQDRIPEHDILCAGFPCQPFSKSGAQRGWGDETRGTLFHEVTKILQRHRPTYFILENVGNFERHDQGRTWKVVRSTLEGLGYAVRGTEHVASRGHGLVSPHHLGYPHTRERFFIVGSLRRLPEDPFPGRAPSEVRPLESVVFPRSELTALDLEESALSSQQIRCINLWNAFIQDVVPADVALPSFPIWSDEIDATYSPEGPAPFQRKAEELRVSLNGLVTDQLEKEDLLRILPSYARRDEIEMPRWKRRFILQNREWLNTIRSKIPEQWLEAIRLLPPSLRKLEWNCHGEERDLWKYVLQFRPSGLRTKRYSSIPALVAMTTTQIPILGPERRFLIRREGAALQGMPVNMNLPESRDATFKALGNAVHVEVVKAIVQRLLQPYYESNSSTQPTHVSSGKPNHRAAKHGFGALHKDKPLFGAVVQHAAADPSA